uniref:Wsv209-like protein n=1 Tax=Penaeus japonicus TaxID=27405 RepID=A0A2Z6BEF8_PENJP|nr:wsv209-like protein [Penaeus japonicus]BDT61751.1 MAG: wsv209-like protein [Marsupenaeus japonicus endogenous nimavirus]
MSDKYEYVGNIPNPYDPNFSYEITQRENSIVEPIGGFLPGENVVNNFASIDCHNTLVYCNADVSSKNYISQCQVCDTIGGGVCLEASHLSKFNTLMNSFTINNNNNSHTEDINIDYFLNNDDTTVTNKTSIEGKIGICVPKARKSDELNSKINHYTTDIVVGVIGDYDHVNDDNGLRIEQTVVTKTTTCKDDRIVRKNIQLVRADPLAASFMNCDDILLCGGEGVGYPIHPLKNTLVQCVDDINFDIVGEAELLRCGCAEGYITIKDPITNLPTCQKGGGRRQGLACPVTVTDGVTGTVRCVCNPATQVSLFEVVDSITKGGLSTDYSIDMVQGLSVFKDEILEGMDTCIPKPGVDPKVSAFGYSFAVHVFYDDTENGNDSSFRLEDNNGGHLMTGGLVRRGGVTSGGDWVSVIETECVTNDSSSSSLPTAASNSNKNQYEQRASYSIGGVSPFLGTGGVPAHIWGGDLWNDNNIIVGSVPNKDYDTIHPNGSLKMVPPSTTGIPGVGVSLEHAVGMIASAGRYYPGGVYKRGGELSTKNCDINRESCFLQKVTNMDRDNPLTQMMSTNDPGVCAAAFVVPFFHDKCYTDYENDPSSARLPREAPTQRLGGLTGHSHSRPTAWAIGYTPIERLFRYFCSTQKKNLAFPDNIISMFPHMIQNNISEDNWQHLFDSQFSEARVDLLGGLFIQPTTVCGSGTSSLNTKWTEEMISVNLPCLVDHYKIDDGRARAVDESATNREVKIKYTKYPTAQNLVANQTSLYTGFSLPGGKDNSGFSNNQIGPHHQTYSFTDTSVFGAENVIWNNTGFSTLALPQDIPVATLPEELRFSKRNDSFGLSKTSLTDFQNKYAKFEDELVDLSLAEKDNIYNPPALRDDVVDFPSKYINNWIPGRRDGLVPSLNLAESFFRMRPFCSRYFFTNKPAILFKDWGSNPHTSGDLFQGIASAPCSKYELGGYAGYPSSGSLNQYVTLLSPRSFGHGNTVHANNDLNEMNLLRMVIKLPSQNKDVYTYLMEEAAKQKCKCLTDIYCPEKENGKRKEVAATPSRGNRFSPYLFCRSTPRHHLPLMYALLRIQNRDPSVTDAITKEDRFNILQNIKTKNYELPVAANRFTATRNNSAFTQFFAREPIVPYDYVAPLSSISFPRPLDYHSDTILQRDDWEYNVLQGEPQYLMIKDANGKFIHERLIDFYESSCRVSPNTICADTFSAWHEGPKGIVAMYGTPVMGNIKTSNNDHTVEGTRRETSPLPMRMIHTYNINTPYMGGFECGQTPAEGMLTRGIEAWYHPFTKSPLGDNVTTTLEGIRARTQEPFERLAVRGFREVHQSLLIKYSLLSHYGVDGLISFAYTDKEARNPISMTNGSARYPFACQSDRVPFPLTMQMTMQTRALLDMNVNKQISNKLEFEERNYIIH